MNLTMLAAADEKWGIGKEGALPWHVPEDLAYFKRRTLGKKIVMGRATVETLPNPLTGRKILTLSRTFAGDGIFTLEDLLSLLQTLKDEEIIIAGGAEVYRQMLPYCSRLEITRIQGIFDCDTYLDDVSEHGWIIDKTERLSYKANIEYWKRS